mgnify:CR=1 FL=1
MATIDRVIDVRATPAQIFEVLADLESYPEWSAVHRRTTVESVDAEGRPKRAKMTVAASYRGRGLGRRMLAYTIAQAKALGAASLYLETNDSLVDAIHLYEALGFRQLPAERVTQSPYARANVFMELVF